MATLKNEFERLKMNEGDNINDFAGKITTIRSKAIDFEESYDEKVLVQKLLNFIPKKFIQIIASIEQFLNLDTMLFYEEIRHLKTFEEITNLKGKQAMVKEDQLLLTYYEWQ
ncbi:uncharacterized protein LOC143570490 [Bidens hawaiensis]|uniref:uncharacterized protein LOC143570490 n=1 Tax=Bidens hawaiensis TaxID=980011 RepID=UPI0040491D30